MSRLFGPSRRSLVQTGVVLAALVVALLSVPAAAFAHAEVTSTIPANGEPVVAGLTHVVLNFTEELSVDQSNATLSANGSAVAGAQSAVDRADRKKMVITFPALTPGSYAVAWKAVTEDDNAITNGTLSFTVVAEPQQPTEGASTSTQAPLPAAGMGQPFGAELALATVAMLLMLAGLALRRAHA